jgi:hypothetical protein
MCARNLAWIPCRRLKRRRRRDRSIWPATQAATCRCMSAGPLGRKARQRCDVAFSRRHQITTDGCTPASCRQGPGGKRSNTGIQHNRLPSLRSSQCSAPARTPTKTGASPRNQYPPPAPTSIATTSSAAPIRTFRQPKVRTTVPACRSMPCTTARRSSSSRTGWRSRSSSPRLSPQNSIAWASEEMSSPYGSLRSPALCMATSILLDTCCARVLKPPDCSGEAGATAAMWRPVRNPLPLPLATGRRRPGRGRRSVAISCRRGLCRPEPCRM